MDNASTRNPDPSAFVTSSGSLGPYHMRVFKNQNSSQVGLVAEFIVFKKDWENMLVYRKVNISDSEIDVRPDRGSSKQLRVGFTLKPGQEIGWAMKNGQSHQVKLSRTRL